MPELRTLPLRSLHVRFGARFTEFAGWEMPLWYGGALAEHRAVRTSCGVFDVSHMGRTRVQGPEGARGLATALTRDPARLDVGASAYALACNERGGIIDDLIVYRRGDEELLVISNAATVAAVRAAIESGCSGLNADVEDVGQGSVLLAVQGRDARDRVAESLGNDVMELPRRRCEDVEVRGESYFLSRTGYTGEDGFEVMTSVEAGGRLLEALVDGGCPPCGLAARDSLRLEAALALHGADIDEATTPWEAGLGWSVEMDHTFVGR